MPDLDRIRLRGSQAGARCDMRMRRSATTAVRCRCDGAASGRPNKNVGQEIALAERAT